MSEISSQFKGFIEATPEFKSAIVFDEDEKAIRVAYKEQSPTIQTLIVSLVVYKNDDKAMIRLSRDVSQYNEIDMLRLANEYNANSPQKIYYEDNKLTLFKLDNFEDIGALFTYIDYFKNEFSNDRILSRLG